MRNRMLKKIRKYKGILFLLGLIGWSILWTAYYVISEETNPRPNLAAAIMRVLLAMGISVVAIVLLLLTKLRWAALGYVSAMILNGIGLLLVNGFDVLYLASSFPFFLPSSFRP